MAKVGRNNLSARSGEKRPAEAETPKVLDSAQLVALKNGINTISKEVCPTSTFTVRRKVPIDGAEIEVQLVPNSLAADMGRQNPAYLGRQLKECWLAREGATVRELLTPVDPMQQEPSGQPSAPGPFGKLPSAPQSAPGPFGTLFGVPPEVMAKRAPQAEAASSSTATADDLGFALFT